MSPEKITSHEPTAVKRRNPEEIKEGITGKEESKEGLRKSGIDKGYR